MIIREIRSKSILSPSKIFPYVINPYVGCQHGCRYCYARYMKKFTGHTEPWGTFVDVKINAVELLQNEILKKKKDALYHKVKEVQVSEDTKIVVKKKREKKKK